MDLMPKISEHVKRQGYTENTQKVSIRKKAWLETIGAAKELHEIEPEYLPNTY